MIMRVGAAMYLPAVVGYWGLFHAETLAWFGADLILVTGYYRTLRKSRDSHLPPEQGEWIDEGYPK